MLHFNFIAWWMCRSQPEHHQSVLVWKMTGYRLSFKKVPHPVCQTMTHKQKNMLVKLKIQYRSSDMCFCVFALKLKANDWRQQWFCSNRRWPAGCMAACTRTVPHGNNMIIKALSIQTFKWFHFALHIINLVVMLDDWCISVVLHFCTPNFPSERTVDLSMGTELLPPYKVTDPVETQSSPLSAAISC